MKIERVNPTIITYKVTADTPSEEAKCTSAEFIFDCTNGQLNINSDAGNYAYKWGRNENENFMNLMSRIDESYLLNKIASWTQFDIKASKEATIKNVINYSIERPSTISPEEWLECEESYVENVITRIKGIYDDCDVDEFINRVSFAICGLKINNVSEYIKASESMKFKPLDYIRIEKDYPAGAKTIAKMFVEYVQPKIKEEFTIMNRTV